MKRSAITLEPLNKKEQVLRRIIFFLAELFAVCSAVYFLCTGERTRMAVAAATVFLLLIPVILERLAKRRLHPFAYVLGILYALGPMLGHSYRLYFILPRWDELLHFTGGVVFAMIGFEIAASDCNSDHGGWYIALFGLCFSMALSLLWEFFEYGMDLFFGTDMQNDTLIHSIISYALGDKTGYTGSLNGIHDVIVDAAPLGLDGYIDIGLHDTMADTMAESLGAVLAAAAFIASRGGLSGFRRESREAEGRHGKALPVRTDALTACGSYKEGDA